MQWDRVSSGIKKLARINEKDGGILKKKSLETGIFSRKIILKIYS